VGTILPQLLAPDQYANANAWLSSSFHLSAVAGPAVGGLLIAWTSGATAAYAGAALAQAAFVAVLLRLPRRAPPRKEEKRRASDLLAGLAFIRRQPIFLAAITLDLFAVLLGGAVALLPIYAEEILHVGPTGLGWLRSAPGLGALATTLVLTRLPPWRRPGVALLCCVAGFGVATVGFGLSRSMALSMACLLLTGAFDSVSVVIRMTLEQTITPDALRGRVAAVNYVFIGMSNELGAFESGAVASLIGPVGSVVLGGVGSLVVVAAVALRWPSLARVGPLHTLRPG
jgi:predicted MFS family arabinose efflux permease